MEKSTLILGILLGAAGMLILIHLLWRLGYYAMIFVCSILRKAEPSGDSKPKTLTNVENMILPRVLKEFPQFDLSACKQQIQSSLEQSCSHLPGFAIHSIMLNDCLKEDGKTVLLFEASVCWQEKKLKQRRMVVRLIPDSGNAGWTVAAMKEI